MPTFNSKNYEFADVSVRLLGRTVEGFRGVKYTIKTDQDALYGRGNKPLSIQAGNKSYEGELTVTQSELTGMEAAIKAISPTKDLTDVSFDIVVQYNDGTLLVTDVIKSARISEYEKGFAQGDKEMEVALKFMALNIQTNV
jgi:hypothetical protein